MHLQQKCTAFILTYILYANIILYYQMPKNIIQYPAWILTFFISIVSNQVIIPCADVIKSYIIKNSPKAFLKPKSNKYCFWLSTEMQKYNHK